jgi:two-component system alkaline phosphatase synthesis response regulator PhoP
MAKKKILLVEDEKSLCDTLALNLELAGYEVEKVYHGNEALNTFARSRFDLIILDIMLPGMNGIEICTRIRRENRQVLILFLSARNLGSERVEGLRAGADDYLSKPFNLDELLLRVEILLRRIPGTATLEEYNGMQKFKSFSVDLNNYILHTYNHEEVTLTPKEAKLLRLLLSKKNQAVSRDEILDQVWGYDNFPSGRTIDNFIMNFRKYVGDDPRNPAHFISVRGVGYMFKEE